MALPLKRALPAGLLLAYGLVAAWLLADYWQESLLNLSGWLVMPLLVRKDASRRTARLGWLAWVGIGLLLLTSTRTALYLTLAGGALAVLSYYRGLVGYLPWAAALVVSPAFAFFERLFSFPVRLEVTRVAGTLLRAAGWPARGQGNMIVVGDTAFAVDPACAGLSLLSFGVLLGVVALAYRERQRQGTFSPLAVAFFLALAVGLSLFNNLMRILLLVLFRFGPEHPWHSTLGLITTVVYVGLPLVWLSRPYATAFLSPVAMGATPRSARQPGVPAGAFAGQAVLLLALAVFCRPPDALPGRNSPWYGCELAGYKKQTLPSGVLKFEKANVLVYVKPIPAFYRPEHGPTICWEGSGYAFRYARQVADGSEAYYESELHRDQDRLHTAWWYDCGSRRTVSITAWRWDALRSGAPYALINVTAADSATLRAEVARLRAHDLLAQPRLTAK